MKLLCVTILTILIAAAVADPWSAMANPQTSTRLIDLPDTDLTGVEERIQDILRRRREVVLHLSTDTSSSPVELAEAYGELGRAAMTYELVELTDVCFTNATELDPENPDWQYLRGVVSQSLQRAEQAVEAFDRALRIRPDDPTATYRQGEVTLLLGDLARSESLFKTLPDNERWAPAANYGLGRVAVARQDWLAAVEYFEMALRQQPQVGEIQHQLGMAYRQSGDLEAARRYLTSSAQATGQLTYPDPLIEALSTEFKRSSIYLGSKAYEVGRFDEALEHYRAAVESDPMNPTYRQALATAMAGVGDLDGAVRENREALRLAPGDAMAHAQLAGAVMDRDGPGPEVIELYEASVELAPDLKEGLLGLARVYSMNNRYGEALKLYGRVLEIEPGDPDTLYGRSQVLVAIGSTAEAIGDLESILAVDPHRLSAILDLSTLLVRSGVMEEAVKILEESRNQEWEPAAEALLAFNSAVIWQQIGEDAKAIAAYRVVIDRAPDFDDAHFNLAAILGSRGDVDGAIIHLQRAVELDPTDRDAHAALATALIQNERFAEARQALERSHRDLPQATELTLALVQVLVAAPDPAVRDPEMAVPLAIEIQEADPELDSIGWVVAALAGAERYGEAAQWQIRLINAAEKAGLPDQDIQRLRGELETFRNLQDKDR